MATRYAQEVAHEGLGKFRVICGNDPRIVEAKARAQWLEWETRYQEVSAERERKRQAQEEKLKERDQRERLKEQVVGQREALKLEHEDKQKEAEDWTNEAKGAIEAIKKVLEQGLKAKCTVDWNRLKEDLGSKPQPKAPIYLEYPPEPKREDPRYLPRFNRESSPSGPVFLELPAEPDRQEEKYRPDVGIIDKLVKARMQEKERAAEDLFLADHRGWEESVRQVESENSRRGDELFSSDHNAWIQLVEDTKKENDRRYAEHVAEVEKWNQEAVESTKRNAAIDERKARYEMLHPDGVEDYCEIVVATSIYPPKFPQNFDLEYNHETRILIVEYSLPAPEALPRLKEIKYVRSKDAFTEVMLSENELNKLYDDLLYQICLRTLHELFEADVAGALDAISLNGWVKSIDKANGKELNACVLTGE